MNVLLHAIVVLIGLMALLGGGIIWHRYVHAQTPSERSARASGTFAFFVGLGVILQQLYVLVTGG